MKPEIPKSALGALAQQSAADEHPSADLLNGLVEQALTPPEKDRVLSHLAACADCREVVFLASGVQPEIPAIQELAAAQPVEPRRGWSGWKWLVPALATIVIASGVIVERHRLFPPSRQTMEVASVSGPAESTPAQPATPSAEPTPAPPQPSQATSKETIAARRRDLGKDAVALERRSIPAEATNSAPMSVVDKTEPYKKNEEAYALKLAKPVGQQMGGPVQPKQMTIQQSQQQLAAAAPPVLSSAAPAAAAKSVGAFAKAKSTESVAEAKAADNAAPAAPPAAASGGVATAQNIPQTALSDKARTTPDRDYDTTFPSPLLQNAPNGGNDITYVAPAAQKGAPPPHWRITDNGQLNRQIGSGSWTRALADQAVSFHTLAVVGDQVWAGGSDGALFHSVDAGERWTRIALRAEGQVEHGTVTSIRFDTASQGKVTTDSGATWSTSDGGATWTKQ